MKENNEESPRYNKYNHGFHSKNSSMGRNLSSSKDSNYPSFTIYLNQPKVRISKNYGNKLKIIQN